MTYLFSSVALALGPLVFQLGGRWPAARRGLDGFVLVTLVGIVGLHIVPYAWNVAGAFSIGFLVLGLLFPVFIERAFARALTQAHLLVVLLAVAGLAVHAVLDGVALLPLAGSAADELALGVIVHRLPVGMAMWWALRPRLGAPLAASALAAVIAVTGLSYYLFGRGMASIGESVGLAAFQSFVAGSLVHLAIFGSGHQPSDPADHGASEDVHAHWSRTGSGAFRLGLAVGVLAILLLPHLHWP
jgi:hypothetical protein